MADEKTATKATPVPAIVARGRSVRHQGKLHGPGTEIYGLPEKEITRLRDIGYLVNPDAEQVTEANGPTFERR